MSDPIITQYRAGTDEDPYVQFIEVPYKVTSNKVLVNEIPDRFNRIQVKDLATSPVTNYLEITQGVPEALEFYVDYVNGIITFNDDANGKTLAISGYGKGVAYMPVSRVYTKSEDGDVVETLGDIIQAGTEAIANLDDVSTATSNAEAATSNANIAAANANTISSNISNAEELRTTAESQRVFNESERESTEATRNQNETVRQTNESNRELEEGSRESNETVRESNEQTRTSAESVRVTNELARQNHEIDRENAEASRVAGETNRESAEDVRNSNESARQASESARISNETTREDVENLRVAAEDTRVTAEAARATAESSRESAESTRQNNESNRITAESTRETQETARESNEATRISQESQRQTDTAAAIASIEETRDSFVHFGDYDPSVEYSVNNEVRYNGSTWRSLQNDNIGITPVEGPNWTLVAQRGVDGAGSVSSVNTVPPDAGGNVSLTASDIGALSGQFLPDDSRNVDDLIDQYPVGISMMYITLDAGFPTITNGVVTTYRPNDSGWGYQVVNSRDYTMFRSSLSGGITGTEWREFMDYEQRSRNYAELLTEAAEQNAKDYAWEHINLTDNRTSGFADGVNNIVDSGFYLVFMDLDDLPITSNGYVIHSALADDVDFARQIYQGLGSDDIYFRSKRAGVWEPWIRLETDSGAQSKADAAETNAKAYADQFDERGTGYEAHAEGVDTAASGYASHAEGNNTEASGDYSHSEGNLTEAIGESSHAEGRETKTGGGKYFLAPIGKYLDNAYTPTAIRFKFDGDVVSKLNGTHLRISVPAHYPPYDGEFVILSIDYSSGSNETTVVVEDNNGVLMYELSYIPAHGYRMQGVGDVEEITEEDANSVLVLFGAKYAHAEGFKTVASGESSHSQNEGTIAKGKNQTALGRYNVSQGKADSTSDSDHALIIGNGESDTDRSNAMHVTWSGDLKTSGEIEDGDGNKLSEMETASGSQVKADAAEQNAKDYSDQFDERGEGTSSHKEGSNTTATGNFSHAEGLNSTASGDMSHAENDTTTASGQGSHAEGLNTVASGGYSHAEGGGSEAIGIFSHAQNNETVAQGRSQTAIGKFNVPQGDATVITNTDHALIVGNGTDDANRSNAMHLTWDGDLKTAGEIEDGNGNKLSEMETPAGAQAKADDVDSQQVNTIAENSQNNASGISSFPNGVSVMRSSSSNGFPTTFGILTTYRYLSYGYQTFTRAGTLEIWYRSWSDVSIVWSAWKRMSTHAWGTAEPTGTPQDGDLYFQYE